MRAIHEQIVEYLPSIRGYRRLLADLLHQWAHEAERDPQPETAIRALRRERQVRELIAVLGPDTSAERRQRLHVMQMLARFEAKERPGAAMLLLEDALVESDRPSDSAPLDAPEDRHHRNVLRLDLAKLETDQGLVREPRALLERVITDAMGSANGSAAGLLACGVAYAIQARLTTDPRERQSLEAQALEIIQEALHQGRYDADFQRFSTTLREHLREARYRAVVDIYQAYALEP